VCYRLWDASDALEPATAPEIADADLAPLALSLAVWGAPDGSGLPWLDPPDPDRLGTARALISDLGAVDARGAATPAGRAMAGMGVHPRFAHLVLRAREMGCPELGCVVASLLSERDLLRGSGGGSPSADIALRLSALAGEGAAPGAFGDCGSWGCAPRRPRPLHRLKGRLPGGFDPGVLRAWFDWRSVGKRDASPNRQQRAAVRTVRPSCAPPPQAPPSRTEPARRACCRAPSKC
jgi:ATP-dependent helicase HrpB